jgi:general secretion pathway protein L
MLREVLAWWAQQMLGLVPERLRQRSAQRGKALLIEALDPLVTPEPDVEFAAWRNGRSSPLGRFTLDDAGVHAARAVLSRRREEAIVLRLPPSALLERQVALPLAAERDPERVLRYEMDRITPFAAEEVFWGWAVEARDRARGRLHLRILLIPKAGLAPLLRALERAGIAPTELDTGLGEGVLGEGVPRRIALSEAASRAGRWRRRATGLGVGVCGALALAVLVLPFMRQSEALGAVSARIGVLQPRVDEAEALRRRMAENSSGADVLASEETRVGDVLHAMATVTDILPDDTYLTDFVMRQRKLTLNGRSTTAAKLIGLLSADPMIRNPTFAAPVTRSDSDKADLFSIQAELRP